MEANETEEHNKTMSRTRRETSKQKHPVQTGGDKGGERMNRVGRPSRGERETRWKKERRRGTRREREKEKKERKRERRREREKKRKKERSMETGMRWRDRGGKERET